MTYFCRLTPGVIPAKAGVQFRSAYSALSAKLDSRLRGNDGVVCYGLGTPARLCP
jgi:hypothetical protein